MAPRSPAPLSLIHSSQTLAQSFQTRGTTARLALSASSQWRLAHCQLSPRKPSVLIGYRGHATIESGTMSDKDQSEESTYNDLSSGPADDSAREDDAGEPESELPSFDAYGDDEEWGALDDDESLSGDPEWTGDNLATLEPDSPKDPNMPPPAAPNRDTDSNRCLKTTILRMRLSHSAQTANTSVTDALASPAQPLTSPTKRLQGSMRNYTKTTMAMKTRMTTRTMMTTARPQPRLCAVLPRVHPRSPTKRAGSGRPSQRH